ncbi:MAG: flavin-containing monooxygenase [Anaerolineae bacterium]
MSTERVYQTIVIGGGQAGLAAGYYLVQRGSDFIILDENQRSGEAWRRRWDSLRLFTPSKYSGLPGMPFPGEDFSFPTKDEAAAYLEKYARQFRLPIRYGIKADELIRGEHGFQVSTKAGYLAAANVIVATGAYQVPHTPPFARELDSAIMQVHSSAYRNPQQFPVQNILVVGVGNFGAEIGLELARAGKKVWLSGRDVGRIPADKVGRLLGGKPYWFLVSRVLSVNTPLGRKMRSKIIHHGGPLIRVNPQEISDAGIARVSRVSGVQSGRPQTEDGQVLPVEGVVWATGFRPDYGWIKFPIFDAYGYPSHQRGIVPQAPGLYFVGLPFQTALSSTLLGGVGADAEYIVRQVAP